MDFPKNSFNKNTFFLHDVCQKEKISKFNFSNSKTHNETNKIQCNPRSNIFLNSGKFIL